MNIDYKYAANLLIKSFFNVQHRNPVNKYAANLLIKSFFNVGLRHSSRSPVNNIRPQSEESKKFYLDRAAAKRARRAERNKRNHLLMTMGDMRCAVLRQNAEQDVLAAVSQADVAASISHAETELVAATGFDLTTKTVAELREVAKARGIKVTTKMTKVDLMRALSVEA